MRGVDVCRRSARFESVTRDGLRTTERGGALILVLVTGLGGCGSDEATRRETTPLLALRGTTGLGTAEAAGLRPALVFLSTRGDVVADGRVSGDFPSSFRLEVTAPPPESTMLELSPEQAVRLGLRGAVAEGVLALLPAAHPRLLPNEVTLSQECDAARTRCTRVTSACTAGRCRERRYDCTRRACEPMGTSGLEAPGQSYVTLGSACAGGACYQSTTSCTAEGDCFASFALCPFERTMMAVDHGTVHTCELVGESGDTSVMTLSDVALFATTHYVTYVEEDNPGFNGLDLVRGYNVVESRLRSPEEYVAAVECATRVEFEALADYNAENGTTYDRFSAPDELDVLIRDRTATSCARAMASRVILDALETPLALELGPYPGL